LVWFQPASSDKKVPQPTASDAGLLGGNINPTPGEISFAHHGVLFLDELPAFKRSVLETMRQPLEEGRVTISRAAGTRCDSSMELLKFAMSDLNLSARAYDRVLKVARTIADLAGSEKIIGDFISEAIQYRSLDRQLWT